MIVLTHTVFCGEAWYQCLRYVHTTSVSNSDDIYRTTAVVLALRDALLADCHELKKA